MDSDLKDVVGTLKPPEGLEEFSDFDSALSRILTLGIRGFFITAGIVALVFLFWGAFDWISSGGEKEKLSKAQQRIFNAVIGFTVLFIILGIVWFLENVVFGGKFCFGLTCSIKIPTL